MAEDKDAAKAGEAEAPEGGVKLFTRKGLIVLAILLLLEGGVMFLVMNVLLDKGDPLLVTKKKIFPPLFPVGDAPIVVPLKSADPSQGSQRVSFRVHLNLKDAEDNKKIHDFNYEATKQAIASAMNGKPTADEMIAGKDKAAHPYRGF